MILFRNIVYKKNLNFLDKYSPMLVALVTVLLTRLIIVFGIKEKVDQEESLISKCIEASMMEIPQRVMMQTFCCGLLVCFHKQAQYAIVINGLNCFVIPILSHMGERYITNKVS